MKLLAISLCALLINGGLFLLMESMVSRDRVRVLDVMDTQAIEFVRTPMQEETRTRDRRSPPPPKPQEIQRPRAEVTNIASSRTANLPSNVSAYEITSLLGEGGGGVALGERLVDGLTASLDVVMASDLIPVSMLPPQYPPTARMRGVEGYVDLLFLVTAEGTVEDPIVLKSEPPEVFDNAARDAALRWRFRPMMRDGQPIDVQAQIHIDFSLVQ
ncbi:MAG: hypothetical protein RLZZ385_1255 [Pseudomonadota bacterium]|jgi:protein TonB